MKLDPNRDVWSKDLPVWERGQIGGRVRPIDRDILYYNLCEVAECLEKYDIKYWLSHGTMLGVYRDNNFIPYDDDADLGVDMTDRQKIKLVIPELAKVGYFIPPLGDPKIPITNENPPYHDTNFIKNGEKIECWWFERHTLPDREVYIYDPNRERLTHNAKYYDNLKTINFKGRIFPIPNYIEDWLVMMYGQEWKIPIEGRKYNHTK